MLFLSQTSFARLLCIASGENASARVGFFLFENPWLGLQSA